MKKQEKKKVQSLHAQKAEVFLSDCVSLSSKY